LLNSLKKDWREVPEVKKISEDINFIKWRTYKNKGYVPHWKIENRIG
jgi:hypothetical protein